MTSRTHGPWQGLDFDPTTDLNRTAALCPLGWLEVYWETNYEPASLRPTRAFAVDLSAPDDYESALHHGPIDFGLEEWPHGRMFIAKLSYERDGDGFVVIADLLRGSGDQPAHADPLPLVTCPKCQHAATLLIPCGSCNAVMCEDCGDEHTPPDCPPEFERYQASLAALNPPAVQVAEGTPPAQAWSVPSVAVNDVVLPFPAGADPDHATPEFVAQVQAEMDRQRAAQRTPMSGRITIVDSSHCHGGLCTGSMRMGGCECTCEVCWRTNCGFDKPDGEDEGR